MNVETYSGIADQAEARFTPGTRSHPDQRVPVNTILPELDLDVRVDPDEIESGTEWPPPRARDVLARLRTYHRVWSGDLRQFVGDSKAVNIFVNIPRRSSLWLAQIGDTSLPIESPVPGGALIVQTQQYGRCYLGVRDDEPEAIDARNAWISSDGESLMTVAPFVSAKATDGKPDRVKVTVYGSDGEGTVDVYEWSPAGGSTYDDSLPADGTIGDRTEGSEEFDSAWGVGNVSPVLAGWGVRVLDDAIPLIVELACRLTENSYVEARVSNPMLALPIAFSNAPGQVGEALLGEHLSAVQQMETEMAASYANAAALPDADANRFARALSNIRTYDTLWQPEDLGDPQYISPESDLADAFHQIELMLRTLRTILPLQSALERDQGEVPAAGALSSMNSVALAAAISAKRAAVECIRMAGLDDDWPDPEMPAQPTPTGGMTDAQEEPPAPADAEA